MGKKVILVKDTRLEGQDTTKEFQALIQKTVRELNLEDSVQVVRAADMGLYGMGLVIKILPSEAVYPNVAKENIEKIIKESVIGTNVLQDLVIKDQPKQMRTVLRNCGKIDPENLEEYLRSGGYQAVKKCLGELTPQQVIEEMKKSGLRGRGGAGFPTWMKWNLARNSIGTEKYIICNGDEGDPGAYMDRSVLEGDPHSVLEGMIIAGYAVGASKGFFYIRAEYPLAIKRIENAMVQAYETGLLGVNILGSSFSFDLEIRLGAGAFVCGEETALIASIEGKRGTPRPRPPFPSDVGLWGKPTVINNVETLANIPVILSKGGDFFAQTGTEKSKGTKVFAVTGKVRNSGLIEIPMGTTIRDIVFTICGGMHSSKKILAVQTGGPSGGVIPVEHLDTPVSYEHLSQLGSIMGSGGLIVMDESDCLVDIAKFYLRFCVDESCGKCAPCRIGGFQMLNVLEKISEGRGTLEDIATLKKLGQAMQKASLCALGQTASNPVMSTLRYFEREYMDHIQDKKCRAGKCAKMAQYRILEDKCKRCSLCFRNCPATAITGSRDTGFVIDQVKCIKCGKCYEVCKFEAVARA